MEQSKHTEKSIPKASEAKRKRPHPTKPRETGLFCVALNGEDARSVKQAILFERSELNRL